MTITTIPAPPSSRRGISSGGCPSPALAAPKPAPLRYLSVCSGIEAATQAWHGLGWQPVAFSEIEKFPCAVLAHHYPTTPNWGDMTKFEEWPDADLDVLCGGTPCQSFSVAGLRQGLADPRGNLMLTFGAIAARYRPRWLCWENVPGVLSSEKGRDFASLLGLLTGQQIDVPEGGWSNSGIIPGIADAYGVAWRVLDAQYVRTRRHRRAIPQRRRRVFVVGYLGDWRRAAAVLFDRESLSGHPAPRREAGQGIAPTISARPTGGGGLGTDFDLDGGVIAAEVSPTLVANGNKTGGNRPPGSDGDTTTSLIALSSGQANAEIAHDHSPALTCLHEAPIVVQPVAPTLRGEGFDASEDGTGKGTPIIPVAAPLTAGMAASANRMPHEQGALIPVAFDSKGSQVQTDESGAAPTLRAMTHADSHQNGGGQLAVAYSIQAGAVRENPTSGPDGVGVQEGHAYTLEARQEVQAVAFDTTQITSPTNASNPQPGDPCHTLAKGAHPPAVAFQDRFRGDDGRGYDRPPPVSEEVTGTLETVKPWNVATPWAVRRLTPVECDRLMGFPDGFTAIPWRKKPASVCPDGPRYKALGNSWAVNVAEWVGERIAIVDAWPENETRAARPTNGDPHGESQ